MLFLHCSHAQKHKPAPYPELEPKMFKFHKQYPKLSNLKPR